MIKELTEQANQRFFKEDAKKAFRTRVSSSVYPDGRGGAYFVTSEKPAPGQDRTYHVRYCTQTGKLLTLGDEFGAGYQAHGVARKEARRTLIEGLKGKVK